jgi:hypothetical protein
VEEVPLIAWEWNDFIFFCILEEADRAFSLRAGCRIGGRLELSVIEVRDESGRCWDPGGLLLLSGCEEDYGNYTA